MTFDEFLDNCTVSGNVARMLLSGIKKCFPEYWEAMPEDYVYEYWELLVIIRELGVILPE